MNAFFLGDLSTKLSNVLLSISQRFHLKTPITLNVKDGLGINDKTGDLLLLCRCSHPMFINDEYCQFCEKSKTDLQEHFRQSLEKELLSSNLFYCVDGTDAFSLWTFQQLVAFADMEMPKTVTGSCFLKGVAPTFGVDSFLSLLGMELCLLHSDYCFIRGFDDILFDTQGKSGKTSSPLDLTAVIKRIACDLLFAIAFHNGILYQSGQYSLFPYHITSSSQKIIDIRSSLYKSLARIDSQKAKGINNSEIFPLRYLSSNVHAFHQSYYSSLLEYQTAASTRYQPESIFASCASVRLDSKSSELKFIPAYPSIDVSNAMNWATGSVFNWKFFEDEHYLFSSPLPSSTSTPKPSLTGDFSSKPIDVSVLTMRSIYGEWSILEECEKVRNCIRRRAYLPLLSSSILQEELSIDRILWLENYVIK